MIQPVDRLHADAALLAAVLDIERHGRAGASGRPDLAVEVRKAARRLAGDAEVQIGFNLDQALAETERCFSCGTCIQCDNCVHYCPDLAVKRGASGYVVLTDYCKGCGLCVKECPTGSMKMLEEAR